jgi:hypothetical protein
MTCATKIEVHWPSGNVSTTAEVAADQKILLREAQSGLLNVD